MNGRARAATLTVLAILVGGLALPSFAGADHVYSHRYVVTGRVVDADGHPVEGAEVPVGTTGFRKSGHCLGTSAATGTTDANGTFYYCLHVHEVDAADQVRVRVAGAEYVKQADPELRVTTFLVYAPTLNGTPRDEDANRSYVVTGKVWQGTEEALLDGVRVSGVAVTDARVTVRLNASGPNATAQAVNVTTDAFGEYEARFPLAPGVTPTNVTVLALNASRTFDASETFLFTRADVALAGDAWHRSLAPLPGAGVEAEWNEEPPTPFEGDASTASAPGSTAPSFWGSGAFYFTTLGLAAVALFALAYVSKRERVSAGAEPGSDSEE